jgi:hypothetical protein
MGVEHLARMMARETLAAAITDVNAEHDRRIAIDRGLIGTVLNALEKKLPEAEIRRLLGATGTEALRTAASEVDAITQAQRNTLSRVLSVDPADGEGVGGNQSHTGN